MLSFSRFTDVYATFLLFRMYPSHCLTGVIFIPHWMMDNLLLDERDLVVVENVTLPVATFAKFEPQSVDFLDIRNPKAVLENSFRNFSCLTQGDVIAVYYNKRVYELRVVEVRPGKAVSIIDCDMEVEFVPPVGYIDRSSTQFVPTTPVTQIVGNAPRTGMPNYAHKPGTITFRRPLLSEPSSTRTSRTAQTTEQTRTTTSFVPFSGRGDVLKPSAIRRK